MVYIYGNAATEAMKLFLTFARIAQSTNVIT